MTNHFKIMKPNDWFDTVKGLQWNPLYGKFSRSSPALFLLKLDFLESKFAHLKKRPTEVPCGQCAARLNNCINCVFKLHHIILTKCQAFLYCETKWTTKKEKKAFVCPTVMNFKVLRKIVDDSLCAQRDYEPETTTPIVWNTSSLLSVAPT